MKKLLALVLVLLLCLSTAACTGTAPDVETTTTPAVIDDVTTTVSDGSATETTTVTTTTTTKLPSTWKPTSKTSIPKTTTTTTTTTTTRVTTTTQPPVVAGSTPLLYKATDANGTEVWLFGSIHVGIDEMYPLPAYVMNAYNAADSLAVECDITAELDDATMMRIVEAMLYNDGTTIADHIPADLYEEAKAILEENEQYDMYLDYYIPSFWSDFINSCLYDKIGYDSEKGIDLHLINDAKQQGKTLLEIESVESQYAITSGFSEQLQIVLLYSAVNSYRNPNTSKASVDSLIDAWRGGNEAVLRRELSPSSTASSAEEQALLDEYNNAMSVQRNILMADFAEEKLLADESVFICVGAAHVVPEGGIVDLLRERGYTVTQVAA